MGNRDLLFEIADRQQGYFTSKQAEESGLFAPFSKIYRFPGEWLREMRGIYRLVRYPTTERPELVYGIYGVRIAGEKIKNLVS